MWNQIVSRLFLYEKHIYSPNDKIAQKVMTRQFYSQLVAFPNQKKGHLPLFEK